MFWFLFTIHFGSRSNWFLVYPNGRKKWHAFEVNMQLQARLFLSYALRICVSNSVFSALLPFASRWNGPRAPRWIIVRPFCMRTGCRNEITYRMNHGRDSCRMMKTIECVFVGDEINNSKSKVLRSQLFYIYIAPVECKMREKNRPKSFGVRIARKNKRL